MARKFITVSIGPEIRMFKCMGVNDRQMARLLFTEYLVFSTAPSLKLKLPMGTLQMGTLQIHKENGGISTCLIAFKGLLPVSLHFDKPAADVSMSKNDNSSSNALTTLEQELDVQIVEKRRKLVAASNTKTAKTRRGEEAGSDATTVAAAAGEFVVCTYEVGKQ